MTWNTNNFSVKKVGSWSLKKRVQAKLFTRLHTVNGNCMNLCCVNLQLPWSIYKVSAANIGCIWCANVFFFLPLIFSKDLGRRTLQENRNPPRTSPENGNLPRTLWKTRNLAKNTKFLAKTRILRTKNNMIPTTLIWFALHEIRYWFDPGSCVGGHQLWPRKC